MRVVLAVAGLAMLVGLLASGCGEAKAPSVASLRTTGATSASNGTSTHSSARQSGVLYAACMRAHGVSNFPDSAVSVTNGQVEFAIRGGLKSEPRFASASKACQQDLPNPSGTPAKQANIQEELSLANCMRSHGISNFPDPLPGGGFNIAGNTNTPQFDAAINACQARRGSHGVHWNGPP
jgi:hypothetical protein